MTITAIDNRTLSPETDPHYEDRINLAAVFRMAARLDMHEAVANHFSYAVSDDGGQFLINPFGRHFSTLRASELLLLDAHDDGSIDEHNRPDPTAWAIHSAMHLSVQNSIKIRPLTQIYVFWVTDLVCKLVSALGCFFRLSD